MELSPTFNEIKLLYATHWSVFIFTCKCSPDIDQYLIEASCDFKKLCNMMPEGWNSGTRGDIQ
jgi:hypothetical protein